MGGWRLGGGWERTQGAAWEEVGGGDRISHNNHYRKFTDQEPPLVQIPLPRYSEGEEQLPRRTTRTSQPGRIETRGRRVSKIYRPPNSKKNVGSSWNVGSVTANSPKKTSLASSSSKRPSISGSSIRHGKRPPSAWKRSSDPPHWQVKFSAIAKSDIAALPRHVRDEARELFQSFEEDPFQPNAQRVRKTPDPDSPPLPHTWRIYIDGMRYRALYDVYEKSGTVLILAVPKRSATTYMKLDRW